MTVAVLGSCGHCGGRVAVSDVWLGIHPPEPRCLSCGAVAKPQGPVFEMQPPNQARALLGSPVGCEGAEASSCRR